MIDDTRFVASGPSLRTVTHSTLVHATTEEVFHAWTTSEGLHNFLGVEAHIELRVGGAYELYFMDEATVGKGNRGSEDCKILSYIPNQLLSFSWNAPPHMPDERIKHTWVVVRLREVGPQQTRVHLTHTGFGEGGRWDEVYEYFSAAWSRVLAALEQHFGRVQNRVELDSVIFAVSNLQASVQFYEKVFGWPRRIDAPVFVDLKIPCGGSLGLYQRENFAINVKQEPHSTPSGSIAGVELYLQCQNPEKIAQDLEDAGATLLSPLAPRDWGDTVAYYADPDGNVIAIASKQSQQPNEA